MRLLSLLLTCLLCSTALGQRDAASEQCRLGIDFYNQGEFEQAIAKFSAAIAINPKDAFAFKCRSFVWSAKGENGKALADINEAIVLDPKDGLAYFSRGNLWRNEGESDKALADYNEAIALSPDSAAAYVNRGTLLLEEGSSNKALSDYNEAIRIDPELAAAYSGRAWIMATCPVASFRNGAKAIEDATKANELSNWKEADQLDTLAAAYAEDGNFDEAVNYQKKAIELATDKDLAKHFLARRSLYQARKPYRSEVQVEDGR